MLKSITVCKTFKADRIPVQCIDTEVSKSALYFKCLMNSMSINVLLMNVIIITVKTISLYLH